MQARSFFHKQAREKCEPAGFYMPIVYEQACEKHTLRAREKCMTLDLE